MANGTVVTRKGLQLIAKLVASETALTFTRVAIGTGKAPGGYDPGSMTGLNEYKMDGSIASHSASGDEASVVMQISSIGVETGFTITEAGLFATDPDEGEILYAYLDMSADPQYMYPENNAISKFIELTLVVKIGEVQSVTAVINPGSLITEEKFEAEKAETVHKSDIINSFSDTAGDHETVMGTLLGYQHDRDINWLKGYAVTKEMISNQNVESTNLVPSAYLLYQLNKTLLQKCEDLLTKYNALNSNIFPKNHASTATTYGLGTTSNYGHVKLSDSYTSSGGAASNGVAASSKALVDCRNNIMNTIENTHADISVTLNKSVCSSGNMWGIRSGSVLIITFYLQLTGTFKQYTGYKLGTLNKAITNVDMRSIAMDQDTGHAHVIGCVAGSKDIMLDLKGEELLKAGNWIWGQFVAFTTVK